MRTFGTGVAMTLLAVSVTGCSYLHIHRSQQAQAPPLQTGQGKLEEQEKKAHQGPPPSSLPQPSAQTVPPQLPPAKQPKVKRAKKRKSAENNSASTHQSAAAQPGSTTPVQPGPTTPAQGISTATSPIGQLTTGDEATGAQVEHNTLALIEGTEEGLKQIKRPLSADEQGTAEQIRTFLKQARQALDIGDSDGAQTLATKAKLLLDELNKK